MRIRVIAVAAALACFACKSLDHRKQDELSRVAKDWCLTIRASQVLPVYPLTEDLQVGDMFLVSSPIEDEVKDLEKDGFLPLSNVVARLQPTGWEAFYNGAYGVSADAALPKQWQFPQPAPTAPPLTAWNTAPGAAFPSYTFQVKKGAGASLAIPIQSVPVGLSLISSGDAYGTVNISQASTYGLPVTVLSPQVEEWAVANRDFLRQYAPRETTDKKGRAKHEQNYLRVVYRVYVAGGVNVSLISNRARGANLDAGAAKPISLFDAGGTSEAVNSAQNYQSLISSLSQTVASATPGGNVKIASASSHGVAMNETFPRPLVIGFLAFDRPIADGGLLGPPIPTEARVTNSNVSTGAAIFGADDNTSRIRAWLEADPANRQKLRTWLSSRAPDTGVAVFLNGEQFRQLRASAVSELGIR